MTQEERLVFLIKYLLNESDRYNGIPVPSELSEQKVLLRSLMNVREPREISTVFLDVQNAYLRQETENKGITDSESLPFTEDKICLWQGDITTLKCGAIVNAANSALLGCFVPCHKCIDNAIHTFSGVQLRLACAKIMQVQGSAEKTGTAKITKAYNLPCNYILHTAGPIVRGVLSEKHKMLLEKCYNSCMDLAEQYGIKSVSFPCISTGEFHFPNEQAAEIAVRTVRVRLKKSTVERVIFNVFKDEDREIYKKLLG